MKIILKIFQKNKLKFLSGFAFKGIAVAVAGIYLILIVSSFFQIKSNDEKLLAFDQIQTEFDQLNKDFSKLVKKKREMQKSLDLGKMINSNQNISGLEVTIDSDIPIGVGLGSSSACCVAAAASISELFKELSSEEILNISIEAEKTIFPDTSGADCTVCTYGE